MVRTRSETSKTHILHADSKHSWLEVPLSEIVALDIVHCITEYSYTDGTNVYLENDVDSETFFKAKRIAGSRVKPIEHVYKEPSHVRSLPRYAPTR